MSEVFAEKEKPKKRLLPAITRGEELHSAIDTLGRSASHIRLTSESTVLGGTKAIARAGNDMDIAANVDKTRSIPVPERFQNLLSSLRG